MASTRFSRIVSRLHIAIAASFALTLAAALSAPASPDPKAINQFLARNLKQTRLPGAAIVVVKDGQVVYLGGKGRTSCNQAIGPDTPMMAGSIAKSVTALAVMQLVEAGRLSLDAPVADQLPEFHPADLRGRAITIRQLLTQTSGLGDAGFAEMSLRQPKTLRQAADRMNGARLVGRPGEVWNYHNPNYHLLARLVEAASGQSFTSISDRPLVRG